MTKLENIKAKMDAVVAKWKDKDVVVKSKEDIERTIDRMKYRSLLRIYQTESNLNGPLLGSSDDIIKTAEEIFGAEAK